MQTRNRLGPALILLAAIVGTVGCVATVPFHGLHADQAACNRQLQVAQAHLAVAASFGVDAEPLQRQCLDLDTRVGLKDARDKEAARAIFRESDRKLWEVSKLSKKQFDLEKRADYEAFVLPRGRLEGTSWVRQFPVATHKVHHFSREQMAEAVRQDHEMWELGPDV